MSRQAPLMRRSTVQSVHLQLVFLGLTGKARRSSTCLGSSRIGNEHYTRMEVTNTINYGRKKFIVEACGGKISLRFLKFPNRISQGILIEGIGSIQLTSSHQHV